MARYSGCQTLGPPLRRDELQHRNLRRYQKSYWNDARPEARRDEQVSAGLHDMTDGVPLAIPRWNRRGPLQRYPLFPAVNAT